MVHLSNFATDNLKISHKLGEFEGKHSSGPSLTPFLSILWTQQIWEVVTGYIIYTKLVILWSLFHQVFGLSQLFMESVGASSTGPKVCCSDKKSWNSQDLKTRHLIVILVTWNRELEADIRPMLEWELGCYYLTRKENKSIWTLLVLLLKWSSGVSNIFTNASPPKWEFLK